MKIAHRKVQPSSHLHSDDHCFKTRQTRWRLLTLPLPSTLAAKKQKTTIYDFQKKILQHISFLYRPSRAIKLHQSLLQLYQTLLSKEACMQFFLSETFHVKEEVRDLLCDILRAFLRNCHLTSQAERISPHKSKQPTITRRKLARFHES